jgi:hypothetical protein
MKDAEAQGKKRDRKRNRRRTLRRYLHNIRRAAAVPVEPVERRPMK